MGRAGGGGGGGGAEVVLGVWNAQGGCAAVGDGRQKLPTVSAHAYRLDKAGRGARWAPEGRGLGVGGC